ncbi:hypothetical protein HSIEG1_2944 [Enterococcus sp. HSIEG1]|nr:hypothetical protein HSIEG1_2944 [Enterococcus sp. HSIEG1]
MHGLSSIYRTKSHHQQPTKKVHGYALITNEAVNFLSNLAIVGIACFFPN